MATESGKRMSFWIPEQDTWLLKTIERLRRKAEDRGIRLSQGDVINMVLIEYLRPRAEAEDFEKPPEGGADVCTEGAVDDSH